MTKAELRATMLAALRQHRADPAAHRAASERICAALRTHPAWSAARCVAAFLPLPSEVQIGPLLAEEMSPRLCFPRVVGSDVELVHLPPAQLAGADWKLADHRPGSAPVIAPAAVDLFLVPGLAFTRTGARLGRGGGYYDRLLGRRRTGSVVLGIAFAFQLVDSLPREPHDQLVDAVVSDAG